MNRNVRELIEMADELYAERGRSDAVRASVELLQRDAPDEFEAAWRMGRSLFFLGQEAVEDSLAARAFHERGRTASERAVRLSPARVEGHFWLGVNLALEAGLSKNFRALLLALSARRALRRAVELDESYHAAGPLRVLARLEHKLPRLFGGGRALARRRFERAIRLAPGNTVTHIYFAELLVEEGDFVEAREQLEMLLRAPTDPAWAFERARDEEHARRMLSSLQPAVRTD